MSIDDMAADLPALDWLAAVLANHADTIGKIKVTAQVTMPGSPIQPLTPQVSDGAANAFSLIGDNYRQMSEATKTARNSYEDLDQAYAAQLDKYRNGLGS